jgi:metallo-beta-lactamase class B
MLLNVRFCIAVLLTCLASTVAMPAQRSDSWSEPFPAHRVIGNVYYVGSKGLAAYLVATPEGHILINSNLESSPALIKQSVEKLGFRYNDIKILLISHAHWDHNAGSALVRQQTGAKYMVMAGDVEVVETGGKADFQYGNDASAQYAPAKVDRVLHHGDHVRLGGSVLTAHLTPGHTKGCTTWTLQVTDDGKQYNIVIVGSPNVNPGYKLVNNTVYPQIVSEYERTFAVLKSLPCDVFLGAHGSYYNMEAKLARLKHGAANPFIDPSGYKAYIAEREQAFRKELLKQKVAQRR